MSLEEWVRSPSQRSGSRARCKRLEPDDDDENDNDDDVDDDDHGDDDNDSDGGDDMMMMLTSVPGGRREANMADSAPLSMVNGPLWLRRVGQVILSLSHFQTWSCRCQRSRDGRGSRQCPSSRQSPSHAGGSCCHRLMVSLW